jgi:hypothetical protein
MEAKELRIGNLIIGISNTPEIIEAINPETVNTDNHDILLYNQIEPIPLAEKWLIKFDFEDWGWVQVNEYEKYKRWVIHNILDGTSNFEVHEIHTTYGGKEESYFAFSVDNDERINVIDTETVHGLQNCFYLMSGFDLTL